jgi:hypothetical protein
MARPAEQQDVAQRDPGIRASDAEREVALTRLREGFAQGRLSQDTFVLRVEAALRARCRGDLDDQLRDLPGRRPGAAATMLARAVALGRAAQAALEPRSLPRPRPVPPPLPLPALRRRFTIGRERGCDLWIGDSSVSRWHADLRPVPRGWQLADLGSTNGTRLNGALVTGPERVRPGDWVSFGAATFVLARTVPVR